MGKIKIAQAAKIMGVSQQFIRVAIQQGVLPFGYAVKIGGNRYTYYINPSQFEEFINAKGRDVLNG